jgi:hypothetical protein
MYDPSNIGPDVINTCMYVSNCTFLSSLIVHEFKVQFPIGKGIVPLPIICCSRGARRGGIFFWLANGLRFRENSRQSLSFLVVFIAPGVGKRGSPAQSPVKKCRALKDKI